MKPFLNALGASCLAFCILAEHTFAQVEPSAPASIPSQIDNSTVHPPESAAAPLVGETMETVASGAKTMTVFPVGLLVGQRVALESILVRGQEDGTQAIQFDQWLIPYSAVIQAFKFEIKILEDGQQELRSPGLVTRIDPRTLQNDPQLGLVFSVARLKELFGVEAKFDLTEYAIMLEAPWLQATASELRGNEPPIVLEGLPRIRPKTAAIAALEQRVNISGSERNAPNNQGELTLVGNVAKGSWFLRTTQTDLLKPEQWRIAEAQLFFPSRTADYILGSQPTFWQTRTAEDYVGFTTIQRAGFSPISQLHGGGPDPRQRLQSGQIGKTIAGRAEPGTLVQLRQGFGNRILGEVLVDSSGIYRFDNIPVGNQFELSGFGEFRIFLYPQGQLTAIPEIRPATFTTVPGQIPVGASAWVVSGGMRRTFNRASDFDPIGEFQDFSGAVAYRRGITEDLTLGIGTVYDDGIRGLAELFYEPSNLFRISLSALTGAKGWPLTVDSDIVFRPFPRVTAQFNSDIFSSRFSLNWQALRNLTLFSTWNSSQPIAAGAQFSISQRDFSLLGRVAVDLEQRVRWSVYQRFQRQELIGFGNESGLSADLSYYLSNNLEYNTGHALNINLQRQTANRQDELVTMSWRYRSPARGVDGNYLWDARVGYGFGSQGSGPVVSLQTAIIPSVLLRVGYEGISTLSNEATFRIELVSSLNFQGGIYPGDRRADYFRTQGGILFKAFFDKNGDGIRNANEDFYTEPNLYTLNNKPLSQLRADVQSAKIAVRLQPNVYRLDLDPSGFPLDWQTTEDAYAVEVTPGNYTLAQVALIPSYVVSGTVTNAKGEPISGASIVAISNKNPSKQYFSVTNDAGFYYLERLAVGTYTLQINGYASELGSFEIRPDSSRTQELNLLKNQNR